MRSTDSRRYAPFILNTQRLADKAGFTLLEIIIVMVIMGIALGIAGIMISKNKGSVEIKTFTKEISSFLRYARSHAVSEKKMYCLVIEQEEGVLRLFYDKTPIFQITRLMNFSSDQYTKNRRNHCKGELIKAVWKNPRYKELKNESYRENSEIPR